MNEPPPDTIIYNCRSYNDPITENAQLLQLWVEKYR